MCQITEGEDKVIPMTPRELEGMIRMSTARAKLLQKEEADIDDVRAVMNLKTAALNSFPGVKVENAGQQMKLMSETDDKEKSKTDIILESKDEDGTVDSTEVCEKWVEAGLFKTQKAAEREFTSMIGEQLWLRGSRYVYTP